MSDQAWPTELPPLPLSDSLHYEPETTVTGFEPEVGTAFTHERATAGGAKAQFSWILTPAQLRIFHEFYVYSLRRGSRPFRMHDPVMDEPATWKITLGTAPSYDPVTLGAYRLSLSLYRLP